MAMNTDCLRPVIAGVNHRSSSLALRDVLFIDDTAQPAFLASLQRAGLSQAVALSTCDRVEVLAYCSDITVTGERIIEAFATHAKLSPSVLEEQLYVLTDEAAVRHCFAVAASLDSLVIGEPQILGQVKAAARFSREAGMCGSEMETLVSSAMATAKHVRSETVIAERPVSIASAAVQVAGDLHGDLTACDGLMIGTGDTGELVAESLLAAGLRRLQITTPRPGQAETLGATLNCPVIPFVDLPALLAEADIVLMALSGRHPLLQAEQCRQALRKRRHKPIFLIDAGIPGDIDPASNRVDGIFLYDLTDLERIAMDGRTLREAAAPAAWAIVERDVTSFTKGRAARVAVPTIVSLRQRFEEARAQVLTEAAGDADKATHLLINRLLHDPSEVMKEIAGGGAAVRGEWVAAERLLHRLFRLD